VTRSDRSAVPPRTSRGRSSRGLWRAAAGAIGLALVLGTTTAAQATSDLQPRIDAGSAYATGRGATIRIAVLDRLTGEYRDNGAVAHQHVESASVMKVFIADDLLHRRDAGQISLSAADLADMSRMLRSSDDAAANRFWGAYGANAIVRDVIARYGLTETGLTSNIRYWGNTLITAHDMVVYYRGLLSGTGGLSTASRGFIIDQLQQSTPRGTDGDWQFFGLRDGLPGETWIGQKQGWMCCVNGAIYRHSTGFVGPDGRYVIAVLSTEPSGLGGPHIEASITGAVRAMFPEGSITLTDGNSSAIGGSGSAYFLNDHFDGAANRVFRYGEPSDAVFVGDWDGNGTDTLAVRRGNAFYLKNTTTGGAADTVITYGDPGDAVFVGDWDGNGTDTLAVRRGNTFYLKNTTSSGVADTVITYGDPGDTVLIGDWDGNGTGTLAVRRGNTYFVTNTSTSGPADYTFTYGDPRDTVLVGRWTATRPGDSLAVRRGNDFHLRYSTESGAADVVFAYGDPSDTAFTGDWDGDGVDGIGVRRQ
jgi:hypothetical protein